MRVAFDVKGTLDAWPKQLGETMTAYKAAENIVVVLTGITDPHVTADDIATARAYLAKIGITKAMYDELIVCPAPHPKSKAAACAEHKIDVLFDNKKATAKRCAKVSPDTLVLVPWTTREK